MNTLNRERIIRMVTESTCYLEIPLQQETVDGSIEISNVLGKRAAMALLPAVDCPEFATVSPLDPHISHARGVLENLDHTEGQILVERILGDNVHEERHCLEVFALRLYFASTQSFLHIYRLLKMGSLILQNVFLLTRFCL